MKSSTFSSVFALNFVLRVGWTTVQGRIRPERGARIFLEDLHLADLVLSAFDGAFMAKADSSLMKKEQKGAPKQLRSHFPKVSRSGWLWWLEMSPRGFPCKVMWFWSSLRFWQLCCPGVWAVICFYPTQNNIYTRGFGSRWAQTPNKG